MLSGLDRERAALRRQRSVAWAWIKARGIFKSKSTPSHAKLTSSVLLSSDCHQNGEEIANWRHSLAAINHRSLARQICDQFYDISILTAWQSRAADHAAAERALGAALPSYCKGQTKVQSGDSAPNERQLIKKAQIMSAVLPPQQRRGAVLLSIKSKAA